MKKRFVPFSYLLLLSILPLFSQCPRQEVNCQGKCGRFVDTNTDSYCDLGRVELERTHEEWAQDTTAPLADTARKTPVRRAKVHENPPEETDSLESCTGELFTDGGEDQIAVVWEDPSTPNDMPYPIALLSVITLLAYFSTFLLAQKGVLSRSTHTRIWNVLLLITFAVSALLGMLLALQINYRFGFSYFTLFLQLHVCFGIAMTFIGIIHCILHWNYYKKIVSRKR